jgi:two-component system cell cycle sensor histidine kinase/response regulator CckA
MVEDSVDDTLLIVAALQRGGLDPVFERVETAAAMQAALEGHQWDLIICDYSMPQFDGPEALAIYQQTGVDIPFISVSGTVGEESVAAMIKAGAHDYVMKHNLGRLVPAVKRELRAAQERRDRRHAESASAYLASIVESCDDAIIGKTLDGTVVSWNPGAERLYGYSAAEMIGRSISLLIPTYRPEELPEIFETIKQGKAVDGLETVRIRKDGTPVEVSLTISPIKDAGGRVVGASTVARDIARRKQEENERLGLIKDLTSALAHVHLGPDRDAAVRGHSTPVSR